MSTVITSVDAGSPAERAGIRAGEQLLMINHHEIVDVLDYRFFCYDPSVSLRLREADGTTRHLTIEKEEGEDLGLNFDTYLMDEPRPCSNHCLFCFVDQMPPNMRDTLYFKDDDARLSFLMGNYITLTNLTDEDVQNVIQRNMSPMNVSVHAVSPDVRRRMMGRNAQRGMDVLETIMAAGIEIHAQIVLCPGMNDGEELEKTLRFPGLQEAAEALRDNPNPEGYTIKGPKRTCGRLFVPDLTFGKHIEMGENVFFYMGEMAECYVIYWPGKPVTEVHHGEA